MQDPEYRRPRPVMGALGGTLALVALFGLGAGAPAWAADPVNAVAVLPLEIEGNVPAGRPALESAVSRGLAVLSGPTIGATESAAKLVPAGARVPCATEACWTAAGRAIDARYLVAGKVERKGPLFEVRFRLVDAPSGRLLATETNKCEVADCSVAELCRTTVRELVRQTLGEPTSSLTGTEPPPVSNDPSARPEVAVDKAPVPIVDDVSGGEAPALAQRASPAPRLARLPVAVPIASIVAGAAALGVGAFYLKREGDCSDFDMECQRWHRTLWGGVGWAAGGVALLGTGIVLAVLRSNAGEAAASAGPTLSVGPGTAFLSGKF